MILQISNYIEALEYMSVEEQFRQSSLAIIGDNAPIKAGTPEYYELARMRHRSMRVLMSFRPKRYLAKKASEDLRFRDSLAKKIARRSGYSRDKAHRFTKAHGFSREADELNNSNALSAFNSGGMDRN